MHLMITNNIKMSINNKLELVKIKSKILIYNNMQVLVKTKMIFTKVHLTIESVFIIILYILKYLSI